MNDDHFNHDAHVQALEEDGHPRPGRAYHPKSSRDRRRGGPRGALDSRDARNAAWRDANLVPAAKPHA